MAAVTTSAIAGVGVLMSAYGAQQQAKAARRASKLNAEESEENARLTAERAIEDERQFRLSFRRDQAKNKVAIAASGVRLEGSPLEVLQDNASAAEADAQNIRRGAAITKDMYTRQARAYREGGAAASQAGNINSAATLLQGAAQTYTTGRQAGAWS